MNTHTTRERVSTLQHALSVIALEATTVHVHKESETRISDSIPVYADKYSSLSADIDSLYADISFTIKTLQSHINTLYEKSISTRDTLLNYWKVIQSADKFDDANWSMTCPGTVYVYSDCVEALDTCAKFVALLQTTLSTEEFVLTEAILKQYTQLANTLGFTFDESTQGKFDQSNFMTKMDTEGSTVRALGYTIETTFTLSQQYCSLLKACKELDINALLSTVATKIATCQENKRLYDDQLTVTLKTRTAISANTKLLLDKLSNLLTVALHMQMYVSSLFSFGLTLCQLKKTLLKLVQQASFHITSQRLNYQNEDGTLEPATFIEEAQPVE